MKIRIIQILFLVMFAAGLLGWIILLAEDPSRAWIALLISFLFFVSLAGGMAAWPAIVIVSNGRWMKGIERIAATGIAFSIPSVLILIVLWFGISNWAPGINGNNFWTNKTSVIIRDTSALVLFWLFAVKFLFAKDNKKLWASVFILIYCIAFSILGFDLVMILTQKWKSALFGGYFFVTGLYSGVSAWTLLSITYVRNLSENTLHDLGRLLLTFCLLTAYLMYSQLLPIWYENLPEETIFLVPRMNLKPWAGISYALVALVYLGPFFLLITERAKRTAWFMGLVSVIVLAGMWIERWWLVMPGFKNALLFGLPEITAVFMCLGIFGLGTDILFNSKRGFLNSSGDNSNVVPFPR